MVTHPTRCFVFSNTHGIPISVGCVNMHLCMHHTHPTFSLSCSNAPHIIAIGLIVVLVAIVEIAPKGIHYDNIPCIVAIASIGSRRPIIVRRTHKYSIYATTYRNAISVDFYAHRKEYRTVNVAHFTESICKLWLKPCTFLLLLRATPHETFLWHQAMLGLVCRL